MANGTPSKPSFSPARKWSIGFNVVLTVVVVFAVVAMVNYFSEQYFKRFYLSTHTRVELAPRTVSLLHSLTNKVQVTLYYDQDNQFYSDIVDLLKAYRAVNHKITLSSVDYYREPGLAQQIKAKYHLGTSTNRNCVIFACDGKVKVVDGSALVQYSLQQVPNATKRVFERKPVLFNGEMAFTSALLAVTNPKPLMAYYLEKHGEPSLTDRSDLGYSTFADIFRENYVDIQPLSLLGTNEVPADCNLLIVAGPASAIPKIELTRIEKYLKQGGRLFALFNLRSIKHETGLEDVLTNWGVKVWPAIVLDPDHMANNQQLVVSAFAKQAVVNPIIGSGLVLTLPRPVTRIATSDQATTATKVQAEPIAFTGAKAYLYGETDPKYQRLPVMAVVDTAAPQGVPNGNGTRMLVCGDSFFLDNNQIGQLDNRDFLNSAINWLMDRSLLLRGVGPRRVTEFYLVVTRQQMRSVEWILLGVMPGGVLLLGGLVWLRRRR